jgi:hypothetical protein
MTAMTTRILAPTGTHNRATTKVMTILTKAMMRMMPTTTATMPMMPTR